MDLDQALEHGSTQAVEDAVRGVEHVADQKRRAAVAGDDLFCFVHPRVGGKSLSRIRVHFRHGRAAILQGSQDLCMLCIGQT